MCKFCPLQGLLKVPKQGPPSYWCWNHFSSGYIYIYNYINTYFRCFDESTRTWGLEDRNFKTRRENGKNDHNRLMGVTSAGWDGRDRFQRERERKNINLDNSCIYIYIVCGFDDPLHWKLFPFTGFWMV